MLNLYFNQTEIAILIDKIFKTNVDHFDVKK